MKFGSIPVGLLMVGLAWLGWNIDNPGDNEIVVPGAIVSVEANAPTVQFIDLSFEVQVLLGDAEDRPPQIGDGREVVLDTDGLNEPRLRNTNPRWLVAAFGAVGLLLVLAPFLLTLSRVVAGGGAVLGGGLLAGRVATATAAAPAGDDDGSVEGDLGALGRAVSDATSDPNVRSAGKEAAGAVLVAEGIVGIENPFNSRNRGGLYSSAIGVLAGIALLLYAPVVGVLVTGTEDDIRVDGTITEWTEGTRQNDEGETVRFWSPTYSYEDPRTGVEYLHRSSFTESAPGNTGEIGTIAFAANNPGSSIVVQPWGKWVRPGLSVVAGLIIVTSLVVVAMRLVSLVAGVHLLTSGRAERRANGDDRPVLTVIRDSASSIIDQASAKMPSGSRGTLLSALVAVRREGRDSDSIHAAKDILGATVLADSLFGLERPFDGENTRLGIFGNGLLLVLCAGLAFLGVWVGNNMGYVGDRSTAAGTVVAVDFGDATIEYEDGRGRSWSIVESDSDRLAGQQVQVVFDPDTPEVATVARRGASAIRWLLLGTGVLGVVTLIPQMLMQMAGIFIGLGLLVGARRSPNK